MERRAFVPTASDVGISTCGVVINRVIEILQVS
jgi:hypothetical protein